MGSQPTPGNPIQALQCGNVKGKFGTCQPASRRFIGREYVVSHPDFRAELERSASVAGFIICPTDAVDHKRAD